MTMLPPGSQCVDGKCDWCAECQRPMPPMNPTRICDNCRENKLTAPEKDQPFPLTSREGDPLRYTKLNGDGEP